VNYRIETTSKRNESFFKRLYDPRLLMRRIAQAGLSMILKRIDRGVAPANAPLTKAVKRGDKTLRDNGRLIASIHERSSDTEAVVASSHIAAVLNHPDDGSTEREVKPRGSGWLTLPASWRTRTLMRKYGWSAREVIDGLKSDGYSVYRPFKKGSNTVRANVVMASLKGSKKGKSGKLSTAKKWEAFAVFILSKKVTVPVRRFLYLDEEDLTAVDAIVEAYYA